MRSRILHLAHNHILSGHLGVGRIYKTLLWEFYWPLMANDTYDTVLMRGSCVKTRGTQHRDETISRKRPVGVLFNRNPCSTSEKGSRKSVFRCDYLQVLKSHSINPDLVDNVNQYGQFFYGQLDNSVRYSDLSTKRYRPKVCKKDFWDAMYPTWNEKRN